MIFWLIQRLVQAAFVVLAMTVIVFIGVSVIGDPVAILISPEAGPDERERLISALYLDRPIWEQYFIYVKHLVQFLFRREIEEPLVGRRVPQEVRQFRGELEGSQRLRLRARTRFNQEQKLRRREYNQQGIGNALLEVATLFERLLPDSQ